MNERLVPSQPQLPKEGDYISISTGTDLPPLDLVFVSEVAEYSQGDNNLVDEVLNFQDQDYWSFEDRGSLYHIYPGVEDKMLVVCHPKSYNLGEPKPIYTFWASLSKFEGEYITNPVSSVVGVLNESTNLFAKEKTEILKALGLFQNFLITGGITTKGYTLESPQLSRNVRAFNNIPMAVVYRDYIPKGFSGHPILQYTGNTRSLLIPPLNTVREGMGWGPQHLENYTYSLSTFINSGDGKILFEFFTRALNDNVKNLDQLIEQGRVSIDQISGFYETIIRELYFSPFIHELSLESTRQPRLYYGFPVDQNLTSQSSLGDLQENYEDLDVLEEGVLAVDLNEGSIEQISQELTVGKYIISPNSAIAKRLVEIKSTDHVEKFLATAVAIQEMFSNGFICTLDAKRVFNLPKAYNMTLAVNVGLFTVDWLREKNLAGTLNRYRKGYEPVLFMPKIEDVIKLGDYVQRLKEFYSMLNGEKSTLIPVFKALYFTTYPGRDGPQNIDYIDSDIKAILLDIFAVDSETGAWMGGKSVGVSLASQKKGKSTGPQIRYFSPGLGPHVVNAVNKNKVHSFVPYAAPGFTGRGSGAIRSDRPDSYTAYGPEVLSATHHTRPLHQKDGDSRSGLLPNQDPSLGLRDVETTLK